MEAAMETMEVTPPSAAAEAADLSADGLLEDGAGGGGGSNGGSDGGSDGDGLSYTVDGAIEAVGLGRFQYLVLAMGGLCYTADAMEMLLISFIKPPLQCLWGIPDVLAALITTSVGVGMLLGSVAWGLFADAYGRRTAFILSALITFVFGLASAAAPTYWAMVAARGVVGFGIGGVPIAFSLIMEFLPRKARGTWGVGIAAFWSVGAVFEAVLAMLLMPGVGFRGLIAASTAPLGFLLLLSPWLPESPRWLASQGRVDAAAAVLARAAVVNGRALPPGRLVATAADAPRPRRGARQLAQLVRPGLRALTANIWVLWFAAAFVYYGAVMLQPDLLQAENLGRRCGYAQRDCARHADAPACAAQPICTWTGATAGAKCLPAGVVALKAALVPSAGGAGGARNASAACAGRLLRKDYVSALWATTGELPGTILTLVVVDRIGRRALIGYLYALSAATFAALIPCPGRAVETASFFVMRAATNGVFQAVYLFTTECHASDVRATGMGVASAVARVGLITTPIVAQYLDNVNVLAAIAIYGSVCVIAVLAVWCTPIETTRRPLLNTTDEMVAVLSGKDPDDANFPSFKRDPNTHPFIRFFRWNARIDGRGS